MASVVAQFFSDIDSPLLGASPTCYAYRLDTGALASSGAMTELANGLYHYNFTEGTGVEYATTCDAGAGAAMPGGRYTSGVVSLGKVHEFMLPMAAGNFAESDISGGKEFAWKDYAGNALATFQIVTGTGRTRTVG